MTQTIENKWKRFALAEIFADWYEHANLDDIFDDMMLEDEQGMSELFDDNDIIVAEQFEDWPLTNLAEFAQGLAQSAQSVAASEY